MAEVKVDISANDGVTPVLDEIGKNIKRVLQNSGSAADAMVNSIGASWLRLILLLKKAWEWIKKVDGIIDVIEKYYERFKKIFGGDDIDDKNAEWLESFKKKVEEVEKSVSLLEERIKGLDEHLAKTLVLDVADALEGARQVRAAIDAIPDVTYKDVVVRYQTQASPVMPFSEGMDYIERRMAALPTGGTYTLRPGGAPRGGGNVTLSPTININSVEGREGRSLARDVDLALADMWRTNRSELRRAMNA